MKILAIGNSFSMNATQYFNAITQALDAPASLINLYIPACSLEMHWNNYNNHTLYEEQEDASTYTLSTLQDVLSRESFDIITLQQASDFSGMIESLSPYLDNLIKEIKYHQPQALLYFHQTWSYDATSTHPAFPNYDCNTHTMMKAIQSLTNHVRDHYNLQIIPTGTAMHMVRLQKHPQSITKDGFHLENGANRILAALTWFDTLIRPLTKKDLDIIFEIFDFTPEYRNICENVFQSLANYTL